MRWIYFILTLVALLFNSIEVHSQSAEKDSAFVKGIDGVYYKYRTGDQEGVVKDVYKLLEIYSKQNPPSFERGRKTLIQYYTILGLQEFQTGNVINALLQYEDALFLSEKYKYASISNKVKAYIIDVYFHVEDYDEVKKQLETMKNVSKMDLPVAGTVLYQFGGYYHETGQWDKALEYYRKSLHVALKGVPNHITRAYNAIGVVYSKSGQLDSARYYLEKCLTELHEDLSPYERLLTRIELNEVRLASGNIELSKSTSLELLKEAKDRNYHFVVTEIYDQLVRISEKEHRLDNGMEYLKKKVKLEKEINHRRNLNSHAIIKKRIEFFETKQLLQQRESDVIHLKNQRIRKDLMLYISLLIIAVLLLSGVIIYSKVRARVKRNYERLEDEKKDLKDSLDDVQQRLNTLLFNNQTFEEFFQSIESTLKMQKSSEEIDLSEIKSKILAFRNSNLMDQEEEGSHEFINALYAVNENLSDNDLRLALFIASGLNSKEISIILKASVRAIETRRYRLRQKLGLSSNENLANYLTQLKLKNN